MRALGLFCLVGAVAACGQSGGSGSQASSAALSTAASTADGGARGTPSAEDIAACTGKAAGDTCTDAVDGGDPGTCKLASDGTTLFCADAAGRGCSTHGESTPSAEDVASCSGKAVNDTCTDVVDGGDPGTCQLASDGATLYCQELHAGGHR